MKRKHNTFNKKIGGINKMKKTKIILSGLFALILIWSTMISAGAASEIFLSHNVTANYEDGGFFVKGDNDSLAAFGSNGFTQSGDMRSLWAFTNEVVEAHPYLKIKLGTNTSGFVKITVTKNLNVEPEIELTLAASGETIIDFEDILADQTTVGYSYVIVYVDGSADFEYIKLSDTGAAVSEPDPTSAPTSAPNGGDTTTPGDNGPYALVLSLLAAATALFILSFKTVRVR